MEDITSRTSRTHLRETFDQAADRYHRARPDYPAALFEELIAVAGLEPGDRLLEVGCATGKATLPLAERGYHITCIELGEALAAVAASNLAGYNVDVRTGQFEEYVAEEPFALVYAATAWHWIDPAVRYERAWQALRPGGHLAFWEAVHVLAVDGDPFFDELQAVYDEIGEGLPGDFVQPRPGSLPELRADVEASGLFEVVAISQYDWERAYTAEEYIELLTTFSGYIAMAEWQRERLFTYIRSRLAERPDGRLRRHWGGVLHVARRLGLGPAFMIAGSCDRHLVVFYP
jgi:SAM-dependent methyltransferase